MVGTQYLGIFFGSNKNSGVVDHTDLDFVGFEDNWKSTTGYCLKFDNGAISWKLKLQECTTTSKTEAEYVAESNVTT